MSKDESKVKANEDKKVLPLDIERQMALLMVLPEGTAKEQYHRTIPESTAREH